MEWKRENLTCSTATSGPPREKRAGAVKEALVSRGIPQTIDSVGKGESAPLCTEKSEVCDEKNRRVEFVIEKQD